MIWSVWSEGACSFRSASCWRLHQQVMKNIRCRIAGAVIQHDDFEVRIILREDGFDTGANIPFLIARGNTDRDERRSGRGRCRLDDNIEMILAVQPVNNNNATDKKYSRNVKIDHKLVSSLRRGASRCAVPVFFRGAERVCQLCWRVERRRSVVGKAISYSQEWVVQCAFRLRERKSLSLRSAR